MNLDISVVTVNFRTPELTIPAAESLLKHYPKICYIIVDNGGCPWCVELLQRLALRHYRVHVVENASNIGHGPALHQAFGLVPTRFVFTLDSDTRTRHGGFLERMLERFRSDPKLFALGWLRRVNANGVAFKNPEVARSGGQGFEYVHPFAALWDLRIYWELEPFSDHGAPAIRTMISAAEKGYHLGSFPVSDYIWHKIAGTRGMYGGRWHVPNSAAKGKWEPRRI